MPEQPRQQPAPSQPGDGAGDSSTGLKKLLLGCGCGVLVMVFVCTGATVALWYTSSSMLPDDAEGLVRRLANLASQQSDYGGDGGGSITSEMLSHGDVPDALGKPLTAAEARSFQNRLEEFIATDAFQNQKGTAENIRNIAKSGGDAGTADKLQAVWSVSEYATQTGELDKAYRNVIGSDGRQFFSRMIRVAALMAAADHAATELADTKMDPLSDQTASLMLERHSSIAKTYKEEFQRATDILGKYAGTDPTEKPEDFKAFSKKMKKIQPALKTASKPGMVAFGRLHPTSFETWSQLGAESRGKLVEDIHKVAGLFPFAKPEAGLKVFQYMLTTPERARLQPQWAN